MIASGFENTFTFASFVFSSFLVGWNGKSYILDNAYSGKSMVESKLEINIIFKLLLALILFFDYFVRTLSLVVCLASAESLGIDTIYAFLIVFIVGTIIEFVFVRLLMIQIKRLIVKNARGDRINSAAGMCFFAFFALVFCSFFMVLFENYSDGYV